MKNKKNKPDLSNFIPETIKFFEMILNTKNLDHLNILIGLSGGPDSVVLLELLLLVEKKCGHKISITGAAHLNHGWRENAHEDEIFCQKLCTNYHLPLEIGYGKDIQTNRSHKGSLEDEGRHKRRIFFEHCREKYNANLIALGHHQDDQLETFFIRLARGTSLEGLGCMRPWVDPYIRPLLSIKKATILELCNVHKLTFIQDQSNDDQSFLRNRIRHNLLTQLNTVDTRFDSNIIRTIEQLQQDQDLLQSFTEMTFYSIFENDQNGYVGTKHVLLNQHARMQQRIIMMWLIKEKVSFTPSQSHINEILKFLGSPQGGKHTLNQSWCIEKKQQRFRILRFS